MGNPGVGVQAMTFQVHPSTMTQVRVGTTTQQIARFLAEDLHILVHEANLDLADWLGIHSDEYPSDPALLVELICNDIEVMLRQRLITGVRFLLSEEKPDQNTNRYRLGYLVEYRIGDIPVRTLNTNPLTAYGGRLQMPNQTSKWPRFALLIDWDPRADRNEVASVMRPSYLFDWVAVNDTYDANSLVEYRRGGLGTVVVRIESTVPGNIPPAQP